MTLQQEADIVSVNNNYELRQQMLLSNFSVTFYNCFLLTARYENGSFSIKEIMSLFEIK